MPTTNQSATQSEWMAAIEATQQAEHDARRAVQKAIDARARDLWLEAQYYESSGNSRGAKTARQKAKFVGRTSALQIVSWATNAGLWRRLFALS